MSRYKIINQNDGNIQYELECTDMLNALVEAVEKLGYHFIQNGPGTFEQFDKDMEEMMENDFDDDQDVIGKYGD